jgi:hypothetical protein
MGRLLPRMGYLSPESRKECRQWLMGKHGAPVRVDGKWQIPQHVLDEFDRMMAGWAKRHGSAEVVAAPYIPRTGWQGSYRAVIKLNGVERKVDFWCDARRWRLKGESQGGCPAYKRSVNG